jgi:hypothetical protein
LGKEECGQASVEESKSLRLLTPLTKLYTGKRCVALASEVLEAFGGAGYIEDTDLPRLLRDAQVLSIWEGTTNVLSLDALRAIEKEGSLAPLLEDARARLAAVATSLGPQAALQPAVARAQAALTQLAALFAGLSGQGRELTEARARGLAMSLAQVYAASLLLEQAEWSLRVERDSLPAISALRFCLERELVAVTDADSARLAFSAGLLS